MAEQRRIDYTVGFKTDKSGLNQVKKSLEEIRNLSQNDLAKAMNIDTSTAQKNLLTARQEAIAVENAFRKAFNQKLNTVNIDKFNQSLKQSNTSLQQVYQNFSSVGATGQNAFRNLINQMTNSNFQLKETSSLIKEMGTTLMNTVKWNIASSAVNSISGSIQQAYGYVKNLDSSLNDIRIVTGKSADEMTKFAEKANDAAKALKKSTTDYTNASLIFYQQGLGDQEVEARTEVTLKAANVTQQDTAEVSEQLTAIWNGYKVSAEETELYIDKVAAVAATTAADLEELSTGMSKVASAANLMGVDIDQLNAQLATVVSVTRQAPESVGTAFKTIYARMGDIEAGLDSETTLGNYTEKMAEMGFNVLDANGKLRDMGEVIEEIGGKWTTLSREQQVALSQIMAGTRQYNNLLSLFDNWDMYTEALETSANAAGTLQEQQDIYAESTKAHLQELATATEGVFDSILDANMINSVADALLPIVNGIEQFVDGLGGGIGLLQTFAPLMLKAFGPEIANSIANINKNAMAKKENQLTIESMQKNAKTLRDVGPLATTEDGKRKVQSSKLEVLKQTDKEKYKKVTKAQEDYDKNFNEARETFKQAKQTYEAQKNDKNLSDEARAEADKNFADAQTAFENKKQQLEGTLKNTLKAEGGIDAGSFDKATESIMGANEALVLLAQNMTPEQFEATKNAIVEYTQALNDQASATEEADVATANLNKLLQASGAITEPLTFEDFVKMSEDDWKKFKTDAAKGMEDAINKLNKVSKDAADYQFDPGQMSSDDIEAYNKLADKKRDAQLIFDQLKSETSINNVDLEGIQQFLDIKFTVNPESLQDLRKEIQEVINKSSEDMKALEQNVAKVPLDKATEQVTAMAEKYGVAIGKITDEESLNRAIEKIKAYLNDSENIIDNAGTAITDANEHLVEAEQSVVATNQKLADQMNEDMIRQASEGVTDLGAAFTSLGPIISTVPNIASIISNDDLTTFEKFQQIAANIGAGLGNLKVFYDSAVSGIQKLSAAREVALKIQRGEIAAENQDTLAKITNLALTGQLTAANIKQALSQSTLATTIKATAVAAKDLWISVIWPALPIIAAVTIAVGALGAAIYAGVKAYNADADAAKKATKIHKELKKVYEDEKQALEDLEDSLDAYTEAQNAIDELTKGTEEWTEATEEANAQVLELLSKYPKLAQYISDIDGRLQISAEGQKALLDAQKEQLNNFQKAEMQAAIQKNKANSKNEITQASRRTGIERNLLNRIVADINIKGLSSLEASILEQNGYNKDQIKIIQENSQDIINLSNKIEANTTANEILTDTIIKEAFEDQNQGVPEVTQQTAEEIAESSIQNLIPEGSTARGELKKYLNEHGETIYNLTDYKIQKRYAEMFSYQGFQQDAHGQAVYIGYDNKETDPITDEAAALAVLRKLKEDELKSDSKYFIDAANKFADNVTEMGLDAEIIQKLAVGQSNQLTPQQIAQSSNIDLEQIYTKLLSDLLPEDYKTTSYSNDNRISKYDNRGSTYELEKGAYIKAEVDNLMSGVSSIEDVINYLLKDSNLKLEDKQIQLTGDYLRLYKQADEELQKNKDNEEIRIKNIQSQSVKDTYIDYTKNNPALTEEQRITLLEKLNEVYKTAGQEGVDAFAKEVEGRPFQAVIEYEVKPEDGSSGLSEDIRKQLEELKIAEKDFERYKEHFYTDENDQQTASDQQIVNAMAAEDNVEKINKDKNFFKDLNEAFSSGNINTENLTNLGLLSDTLSQLSGGIEFEDDWITSHFDLIQQFLNGSEEARQAIEDEANKLNKLNIKDSLKEMDSIFNKYSDTKIGAAINDELKQQIDTMATELGWSADRLNEEYAKYGYTLGDDGIYYKNVELVIQVQNMFSDEDTETLSADVIKKYLGDIDLNNTEVLEQYGLEPVTDGESIIGYKQNFNLYTTFNNSLEIKRGDRQAGVEEKLESELLQDYNNITEALSDGWICIGANENGEQIWQKAIYAVTTVKKETKTEERKAHSFSVQAMKNEFDTDIDSLIKALTEMGIPYETKNNGTFISYYLTEEEVVVLKNRLEDERDGVHVSSPAPSGETGNAADEEETPKVDVFRDVNAELEKYNAQLERLQKNQEDLTGKDLEENLQKQAEIYEKQADAIERKLKLQQQELAAKKKELAGFGVSFDEEGYITNGVDRLSANINNDEEYKKLEKAISEYEDALSNTISLQDDFSDSIRSSANKQYEANLAGINGEIDDSAEALEKAQKEYEKFSKEFEDMTDEEKAASKMSFGDFMISQIEAVDEYLSDLEEKKKQIEEEAIKLNIGIEFDENGENNIDDIKSEYVKKLDEVNEKLQDQSLDSKTREELIAQSEEYSNIIGQLDTMKDDHKEIQEEIEDSTEKAKEYAKAMDISRFIKENTDVYYDVNKEMDGLDRQLNHLQKASKGLEGTALINNLQQQSKIIDQQIKAQKTKIALAKQELKTQQGLLQTKLQNLLADKKITATAVFDEVGMVDNYNDILKAMEKANDLSEEDAKIILGLIEGVNNAAKESISLNEELLDLEYSKEDIQQQIQDVYSSMAEEGQKAAEDAAESMEDELNKRLEWFNMKVDVELDISEATRRLNDLKKRIQGLEDNDILGNAVKNLENLKTYFTGNINSYFGSMDSGAISGLTSHLNAIMGEIGIMQAGGTSSLYGTDQSKAFDDLNNYRDQLMDQLESVEDLKEQIEASYLQMIDKIADKLSDIADDYKQIDSLIQHDMNLIKMVYGENSFDKLALYFDQKVSNDMGALAQARQEQERWKELLDSAEKGSEAWDKYYQNYKNATNNLNSLLESSIQDAMDRYNNLVNKATSDLTKKLSGGYNQDYIDADWEHATMMSDKYLDNINKAYEIQSLRSKMNTSISDTASLKAQQKIRDVMEEQLKILEDKEYVTQYDVDRANKIYDITMKQIALEEAQNNKSQMKLRRDSQGNYRYEYVSDQDDIAQKEQELLEAQNNLYNFDKDRYKEVLQEAEEAFKEYSSKYVEILTSTAYTEEEKAQLIDQLKANYYEAQKGRAVDLGTVETNLLSSANELGEKLLGEGVTSLEEITDLAETSTAELVHNTFGEEGPINTDITNTFDNLRVELENLQNDIKAMAEQAGVDFEQLVNGIDPAIEYTKELINDNKDLLASYDEELEAISRVIAELANLEAAYNKVKEAAIAAIEEALKLREQESLGGDLGGDSGTGSETGDSGSNGNSGGGNYGGDFGKQNQKPSGVTIYKGLKGDYANIMYVKKESLKNTGITTSDISTAAKREGYGYAIIDSITMKGTTPWVKAINNSNVTPEKAVRKDYLRFDTGGYTGDWNSKEGKIAMLHEKELVLNKQDTSNILMAVSIVRTLSAKLSDMTNNMMNSINSHNAATAIPTQDKTLEQNVKIEASFPNVKNSNDIEQALNNLVNTASMYAMRTKR